MKIYIALLSQLFLIAGCGAWKPYEGPPLIPRESQAEVFRRKVATLAPEEVISLSDQKSAEVNELIADLTCKENAHCSTIGFGAKPCGGPHGFLVYSNLTTDEQKLRTAVLEYQALNERYNLIKELVSDCAMESPPGIGCIESKCQIRR